MNSKISIKRKLSAIVVTDIAGFTSLSGRDEVFSLEILNKQKNIITPLISKYNGKLQKEMGDGLLFTFDTVTDAIRFSIDFQNEAKNIDNLNLRIGIHEGEINFIKNDVIGDDVNITYRIESFSPEGGVAISGKVQQDISSLTEFETQLIGIPDLKGVSKDIEVHCIVSHGLPKSDLKKVSEKVETERFSLVKKILFPLTGFIFTLIGAGFWFIYPFISISIADEPIYESSIAILYFENRGSSENEYFVNGLTEELINRFSRIKRLKVAPRMDVAFYKGKQVTIDQIADQLNVDYLLNGSVTIIEDQIRVNLELSNTSSKEILWSDNITDNLTDIFEVQDKIAEHIKSNIDILFSHDNLLDIQKRPTNSFKAYELICQATTLSISGNNNIFLKDGKPLIEEALKLDPTYSDALALLALTTLVDYTAGEDQSAYDSDIYINNLKSGKDLAYKALEYDPTHPLGLSMSIAIPMLLFQEESRWFGGTPTATQIAKSAYTMRNVAQSVKIMAEAYPESPYTKTIVGLYHWFKRYTIGSEDDIKIAEKLFIEAWDQIKNKKITIEDIDYQTSDMLLRGFLPQFWNSQGYFKKTINFIKQEDICEDDTYNCLEIEKLDDRIFLLYQAQGFEEVLKVFDAMVNKTDEEFENQMVDPSIKRYSYFSRGMVNMKIKNYNIALESFNKALKFNNNIRRQNVTRGIDDLSINHIMGYTYYLRGDYKKASAQFSKLIDVSNKTKNIETFSINALVEFKMGNIDKAKNDFDVLEQWLKGSDKHDDYWGTAIYLYYSLFQYYQGINNNDRALEMLKNAYNSADKRSKRQYLEYRDSTRDDKYELAKFFWAKDIIEDYKKYVKNN